MKISWLGHASFLIETVTAAIVTDPFDSIGIDFPDVEADIVIVSHDHFDHCAVEKVKGNPTVVRSPAPVTLEGIEIFGTESFHDKAKGAQRGANIIFTMKAEELVLTHLGDLGHILDEAMLRRLGDTDVLLIPVGGTYTIDSQEAVQVTEQISPRVVMPMHYKIPGLSLAIDSADQFISAFENVSKTDLYEVTRDSIPDEMEVVVLSRKLSWPQPVM